MFSIEFDGIDEIISKLEIVASKKEIDKVNKKALQECGELAKAEVKATTPRSNNTQRSGRKGSRTGKHMGDNIPLSIKSIKGEKYVIIGWGKGDISPYYYSKFVEWGSSKQKPLFIFQKAFKKQRKQYDYIFQKHYEELIKQLEG